MHHIIAYSELLFSKWVNYVMVVSKCYRACSKQEWELHDYPIYFVFFICFIVSMATESS